MILSENAIQEIKLLFIKVIESVNIKRFKEEPYNEELEWVVNPFNTRLIPTKVWKSSKYERSFVTSLGNVYEEITRIIGEEKWGIARRHYNTEVIIFESQENHIHEILRELEHRRIRSHRRWPSWEQETRELHKMREGPEITAQVISDIYLFDKEENKHCYIELKSPKPNKDQSKVSKEKMLRLECHSIEIHADILFCLPFNPYVKKELYDHSFPRAYFNMRYSPVVLMGKEYWDYVGKEAGTYEELLMIAEEVGKKYRKILDEYLK